MALTLHLRADWAARNLAALPTQPGVYAVTMSSDDWLRTNGLYDLEPTRELGTVGGRVVIYVGATVRDLQTRLREHLLGRAYASTLRQSLACLLADDLGLGPHGRWSVHLGSGELALNRWIGEHLGVSIGVSGAPLATEQALVRSHRPPLNLHDCELTPFSRHLRKLRAEFSGRPSPHSAPPADRFERLGAYQSGAPASGPRSAPHPELPCGAHPSGMVSGPSLTA